VTRREFIPGLLQVVLPRPNLSPRDICWTRPDLEIPAVEEHRPDHDAGRALPGKRFRIGTPEIHHVVHLPTNWQQPNRHGLHPLIVEFFGNGQGALSPRIPGLLPDRGLPDDAKLGYGLSGGRDYVSLSLPFVEKNRKGMAAIW
jgi:hypothetical protein